MYTIGIYPFLLSVTPQATSATPLNGTWSIIDSLKSIRGDYAAILLEDGRVLVAGGSNSNGFLSSTDMYNPSSGTWSTITYLMAIRFTIKHLKDALKK